MLRKIKFKNILKTQQLKGYQSLPGITDKKLDTTENIFI